MAQHTRRDVLLAGLALPGIAGAFCREPAGDDGTLKPKRFEENRRIRSARYCRRSSLGDPSSRKPGVPRPPQSSGSGLHHRFGNGRKSGRADLRLAVSHNSIHALSRTYGALLRNHVGSSRSYDHVLCGCIVRNIVHLGFRKVFLLNGHDGNIGAGRGAIAQIADETKDAALLFASWWEFLPSEVMKNFGMFHQDNGGHGHSGPLETSAVLAFRPDLIHLSKAQDLPEPPDLSGEVGEASGEREKDSLKSARRES
jgi:hypothetical protein